MKHLNPRQGITTDGVASPEGWLCATMSVKHLNPRQGITTDTKLPAAPVRLFTCV